MKQGHLIAGVAAILACVLGWELATPRDLEPDVSPRQPILGAVPRPGTDIAAPEPDLAAAAAVALARPLFSHDRRPGEERHQDGPAAQGDGLPRLSGVIVGPEGHRALFTDAAGKSRDATEGDTIGRYVIRGIQPGIVVLLGPEGERVLYTSYAKLSGAKAPAAGAPGFATPGTPVAPR